MTTTHATKNEIRFSGAGRHSKKNYNGLAFRPGGCAQHSLCLFGRVTELFLAVSALLSSFRLQNKSSFVHFIKSCVMEFIRPQHHQRYSFSPENVLNSAESSYLPTLVLTCSTIMMICFSRVGGCSHLSQESSCRVEELTKAMWKSTVITPNQFCSISPEQLLDLQVVR